MTVHSIAPAQPLFRSLTLKLPVDFALAFGAAAFLNIPGPGFLTGDAPEGTNAQYVDGAP